MTPVGPHLVVSGPTGSGKTRSVLGPATLMWAGPVVAISSKPDLLEISATKRIEVGAEGKVYVLDLSGAYASTDFPDGVTQVYIDPCRLIRSDDDARKMASDLVHATTGEARTGDGAFWERLAMGSLAAILRAAGSSGVGWACRAKDNRYILDDSGNLGDLEDQLSAVISSDEESWVGAYGRLKRMGSDALAERLVSDMKKTNGQGSSIQLHMDTALDPWLMSSLLPPPDSVIFTPTLMQDPLATLFVISPTDGPAPAIAELCLNVLLDRWRANQTEQDRLPRLLIVADELCNTVPWKKLPVVLAEARGMNIAVVAAVQSTEQFARRYGTNGMHEIRTVMPSLLCLQGAGSSELWAWEHVLRLKEISHTTGARPYASPPDFPNGRGEAVIFHKSFPDEVDQARNIASGAKSHLVDIGDMVFLPFEASPQTAILDLYPESSIGSPHITLTGDELESAFISDLDAIDDIPPVSDNIGGSYGPPTGGFVARILTNQMPDCVRTSSKQMRFDTAFDETETISVPEVHEWAPRPWRGGIFWHGTPSARLTSDVWGDPGRISAGARGEVQFAKAVTKELTYHRLYDYTAHAMVYFSLRNSVFSQDPYMRSDLDCVIDLGHELLLVDVKTLRASTDTIHYIYPENRKSSRGTLVSYSGETGEITSRLDVYDSFRPLLMRLQAENQQETPPDDLARLWNIPKRRLIVLMPRNGYYPLFLGNSTWPGNSSVVTLGAFLKYLQHRRGHDWVSPVPLLAEAASIHQAVENGPDA